MRVCARVCGGVDEEEETTNVGEGLRSTRANDDDRRKAAAVEQPQRAAVPPNFRPMEEGL